MKNKNIVNIHPSLHTAKPTATKQLVSRLASAPQWPHKQKTSKRYLPNSDLFAVRKGLIGWPLDPIWACQQRHFVAPNAFRCYEVSQPHYAKIEN